MIHYFGFRDQPFSDETPLYVKVTEEIVVNSRTYRSLLLADLLESMASEGYSPKPGEIDASPEWESLHHGWWTYDDVDPPIDGGDGVRSFTKWDDGLTFWDVNARANLPSTGWDNVR